MDPQFETDLVRNTALGAMALWQFSASYYRQKARLAGAPLPAAMLVLPMAFHEATVSAIADRNRDGALLKALASDRVLTAGLQHRIESFTPRTFRALNLAAATGLIDLPRDSGYLVVPLVMTQPIRYASHEAQKVLKAADRIGHAIASLGLGTCCSLLNVRF